MVQETELWQSVISRKYQQKTQSLAEYNLSTNHMWFLGLHLRQLIPDKINSMS